MRLFILAFFCFFIIGASAAQNNQSPYDLALQRIRASETSGGKSLSLAGMSLTELPPEIGNLVNLETLWLNHNDLQSLPPEIGNLENLQELSINHNQLRYLPPEIGNLANLRDLDLSYNQLETVPAEIAKLGNLAELYLSHNLINHLPAEMGELTSLLWLDLSDNQLSNLPREMGQMQLQHLDVERNPPPLGDIAHLDTRAILGYVQVSFFWIPFGIGAVLLSGFGAFAWKRRKKQAPKRRRIKNRAV